MNQNMRILIVEDELLVADDLQEILQEMGYETMGIKKTGEHAISFAADHDLDLILMDINLSGDMDGITAAELIRERKDIPVIFITAFATSAIVARAKMTKPYGYILKPYSESQIRTSIEIALFNHSLERQIKEQDATIQMLVNTAEDALMLMGPSGIVQYANQTMARWIGIKPGDMIGVQIEDLKDSKIINQSVCEQMSGVKAGNALQFESLVNESWIEYSLIPVQDSIGDVTRIGLYCHDITIRKKIELDLHTVVGNLLQEREMFRATKDEFSQMNSQLRERIDAHSTELCEVQQLMAKNRLFLSLIISGDRALKEGLDESSFLNRICAQIISLEKYQESWVISLNPHGKPVHLEISERYPVSLTDFISLDGSLQFCPSLGITGATLFKGGGEICVSCPLYQYHKDRWIVTAPIKGEEHLLGILGVVLQQRYVRDEPEEITSLRDICINIEFALRNFRSSDRERLAFQQISKNIGVLSVLNDEIRNPLTIIAGLSELEGGNYMDGIIEQVNRIDKVIERLDGGFLESIKVYEYLRKHYEEEKGEFTSCT